jgi:hypothetical protein
LSLAAIRCESGKIVGALEHLRASAQRLQIERRGKMPGAAALERGQDGPIPDPIKINFAARLKAGVEVWRRATDAQDADFSGEMRIQRIPPFFGRESRRGNIGVRNLPERVDAGVGPSGTVHRDADSGDVCECALETILDGVAACLALPAFEACAIVGNEQFEPFNGRRASRWMRRPRR